MLKSCLTLLVALALATRPASAQSGSNTNAAYDTSSVQLLNVTGNSNRVGFEAFYSITNFIIDLVFVPRIPEEIWPSENQTISELSENFLNLLNSDDWKEYAKLPFKLYPSLVGMTIACLLLAFLIPNVGLITCLYRCCCRGKRNPQDAKRDTVKRKFNTVVLFVLLVILLLTVVILFFTNQNANYAVNEVPVKFKKNIETFNEFRNKQVPDFFNNTNLAIGFVKDDLVNSSMQGLVRSYVETLSKSEGLNKLESLLNSSFTRINELSENLASEESKKNLLEIAKVTPDQSTIKSFVAEIDTLRNKTGSLTENISLEKWTKNITSQIENLAIPEENEQQIANMFESVNGAFTRAKLEVDRLLESTVDPVIKSIDDGLSDSSKYYKYLYFFLMGICVFMLLLFVLYGMGMVGICGRRPHRGQSCHRGTSANVLLAGVGCYFLAAWLLFVVTVALFVPGIMLRHLVCKPAIELDDNAVLAKIMSKRQITINDRPLNLSQLLNECEKYNQSSVLNEYLLQKVNDYATNYDIRLEQIKTLVDKAPLPKVKDLVEKLTKPLLENFNQLNRLTNLEKTLGQAKDEVSKLPNSGSLRRTVQTSLDFIKEVSQLQAELGQMSEKGAELDERSKSEIASTLKAHISAQLPGILSRRSNELIREWMPSCQVAPAVYKTFAVCGCFEWLDNLNTFWLTLLIASLVHLVVLVVAMKQADLFRKSDRYDEMTDDLASEDFKEHGFNTRPARPNDVFQTKSSLATNVNGPIDAYEMEGFHTPYEPKFQRQSVSNRTPPPEYRASRA